MALRFLEIFLVIVVLAGCGLKLGTEPWGLQKSSKVLAVTTTNYQSGALAVLDLESRLARLEFSPVFSDAIVKSFPSIPDIFVINRLGADNIQKIDRDTGKTLQQFSVGLGMNPQDLVVVGKIAYISSLKNPEILKMDLSTGAILQPIDLRKCADLDGAPEAAWMELKGDELWVQLQRLDKNEAFSPVGLSQLGVINTLTDEIVEVIDLKGTNPVAPFKEFPGGKWLITEAGFVGGQSRLDGGIEMIDPNSRRSLGWVTTESQLGGDLVDVECPNSNECLAIVSRPETELVVFDVRTGVRLRSLWLSTGYDLRQILMDRDSGLIYVADGNPVQPKIRVWDSLTLQQRVDLNWSLILPPYQMTFLK